MRTSEPCPPRAAARRARRAPSSPPRPTRGGTASVSGPSPALVMAHPSRRMKQLDRAEYTIASMETAMALTGMEYGGITPVGLPAAWALLFDEAVATSDRVIIGSGV